MAVAAPARSAGRVALLGARPGALGRRAAATWVLLGPGGQPLAGGRVHGLQRLPGRASLDHLREEGAGGDGEPRPLRRDQHRGPQTAARPGPRLPRQ